MKIVKRIIFSFFGLVFVGFIAFQIYMSTNNTVKTQTAMVVNYKDSLDVMGFAVRNEQVLTGYEDKAVCFLAEDGEKVRKGSKLAYLFDSEQHAVINGMISELEFEVERFNEVESSARFFDADPIIIKSQIREGLEQLHLLVDKGDLTDLNSSKYTLHNLYCKEDILTGKFTGLNEKINQLESQISTYKNQLKNKYTTVVSTGSGYFSRHVDGLENKISISKLASLQPTDLKKIIESSTPNPDQKVVGKLVNTFEWYISCVVTSDKSDFFKVGRTLNIRIPFITNELIPVTVAYNIKGSQGENTIVFKCDIMNSTLVNARVEFVQIIMGSYTGIRVDSRAIRVVDSQQGVYVRMGQQVKFKKLDILHSGERFVISSANADSSYLQIYDEIIVEGKDIYEGKVVR